METVTKQQAWGRHGLMALAAFRYCLGRRTYITGDCADWLCESWPLLDEKTKTLIKRELDEAFAHDDEDTLRPDGDYRRLGDSCDRASWERVRDLYA